MKTLHYFPNYASNPYQRMLHGRLGDLGIQAAPVEDLQQFLAHANTAPGCPSGPLHVHWTAPVLQSAGGPFSAAVLLGRITEEIERFKARGAQLVWTVHNVLPHDSRHPWAEIQLARLLAEHADQIQVMSEATLEAVRDYYDLDPRRVTVLPHASYLGEYPDSITRSAARSRLGVDHEATVLLALGGIRPYKGLGALLDVFDELLNVDPTLRLLVAGRPTPGADVARWRDRCAAHPGIVEHFGHVPDHDVQVWMRAADLAVLPYRQSLNSGAFRLAETFGLPIVAPRTGAFIDTADEEHVRLFEPGDHTSLRDEITVALRDQVVDPAGAERAEASARRAAARFTPDDMARAYAQSLATLLRIVPTPERPDHVAASRFIP